MNKTKSLIVLLAALLVGLPKLIACTNLIVTKGASTDGSVMVSYSADSHQLYGELYFWPAADYPQGSMLPIYEWDSGKYLGEIPQATHTYSVVGNMNEHQLVIGETTFGGREEFVDTTAIMDYGSLMFVALQRAKTAREALSLIDHLMQEYGYASSGESFSIADPDEVWIMEVMPKAPRYNKKGKNLNKGAVWVAKRIPEGHISAHANQARISTIDFDDPDNCLYSRDVISHAREQGIFAGKDAEFSFCEVYAPLDFGALRYCEARVWAFFNKFAPDMDQYLAYAMGYELDQKMPLSVQPLHKLSVKDVADMMRDHYEGTPMDMTQDIGAGGSACPYRWRPMEFEVDNATYLNERAIATQQTGWWYVAQCRDWLPRNLGGLFWFGVDDAATSPLLPIYSAALSLPECVRCHNGSMLEYSPTSLFWLNNRIAQFAYLRYDAIGAEVRDSVDKHELDRIREIPLIDRKAAELYALDEQAAKQYLTEYSLRTSADLFDRWKKLDTYLLVKYIDGNTKQQDAQGRFKNNGHSPDIPASPAWGGYNQHWKEAVVKDKGDVLRLPANTP